MSERNAEKKSIFERYNAEAMAMMVMMGQMRERDQDGEP